MQDSALALIDWTPFVRLLGLGTLIALAPLAWIWLRHRGADTPTRLRALTLLTLFLTFDLVLFGAFTRLTDSGLGCPDWPGCYGHASPVGAQAQIGAAQAAMPTGPVTHGKAWIEMIHRYLASAVGLLIVVMTIVGWALVRQGRAMVSPWWATLTLVWVIVQGAFGALTVTMKLYPAIVTLHLLGGVGLLALLAAQAVAWQPRPLALARGTLRAAALVTLLVVVQITLGGWVSTNYAVLACTDFPTCQGSWWPTMDFREGFTIVRELGQSASGDYLPFAALTAIHVVHRLAAAVVLPALALLAWWLRRAAPRFAWALAALAALQFATGLGNIVLGWPLAAAVLHTGGAAALVVVLTTLLARAAVPSRAPVPALRARAAS